MNTTGAQPRPFPQKANRWLKKCFDITKNDLFLFPLISKEELDKENTRRQEVDREQAVPRNW